MEGPASNEFSQRANEVAEDLFADIAEDVGPLDPRQIRYHLDGSDVTLPYEEAVRWVRESVDKGHPHLRHYVEQLEPDVVVNLAAFEDPDSHFYP